MHPDDVLDTIADIATRFAGLDVQYRRSQPEWSASWRATLVANKNERSDYRITVYGETLREAISKLRDRVRAIDVPAPATPPDLPP